MAIPQLLLITMFYFVCLAVDVMLFFLMVRALVVRWPTWWLVGFDAAGRWLVDGLLVRVQNSWIRFFQNPLSDRGKLIVAITVFYVAWLIAHGIAAVVW